MNQGCWYCRLIQLDTKVSLLAGIVLVQRRLRYAIVNDTTANIRLRQQTLASAEVRLPLLCPDTLITTTTYQMPACNQANLHVTCHSRRGLHTRIRIPFRNHRSYSEQQ